MTSGEPGWFSGGMMHDAVTTADRPGEASLLAEGRAHLGLELGSTRIKAALIDDHGTVLGTGSYAWENQLVDHSWTYSLDTVRTGIQDCYADLVRDVRSRHGVELTRLAGLGISGMMHGYLPFDADGRQLAPFRTWRNTYTTEAARELGEALGMNIPLRWSVAHLLHAIRGDEEHVRDLARLTTLSGYVHRELTGRSVLGVGDASGMFPISAAGDDYDPELLERFAALEGIAELPWSLPEVLPEVLVAGQDAGTLTAEGAALLDPTGTLQPGAIAAPPEGAAGTDTATTHPTFSSTSCIALLLRSASSCAALLSPPRPPPAAASASMAALRASRVTCRPDRSCCACVSSARRPWTSRQAAATCALRRCCSATRRSFSAPQSFSSAI